MFAASKSGRRVVAATDPFFPYVPLLLETTSTNGQQNNTFLDSSTNNFTITRNGTPTQGSVTPYWSAGQWSNYFSSSYLSVADSASLRFGSANFTIEAWVYRTASGATHTIACKGSSTGPTGWVFQVSSADKLVFIDTSTSITGSTSLAANTWYYVAVVRAGTGSNQTTLYLNGASDGTGTSATTFNQTDAMRIGTDRSAANGFAGHVSNLRLSNTNLAISSTPTTPLTVLGSTIFLSCGYNRFVDGSTLASAITVGSGTPQAQAFQPFPPAASYTTALYGGSGYFNGSTDYLTVSANSFTTGGTWTIECWCFLTQTASTTDVIVNGLASDRLYIQFTNGSLVIGDAITNTISTGVVRPVNQWFHLAVVKNSGTYTAYINGSSVATSTTALTSATLTTWQIGARTSASTYCTGYLSNLRIVSGTAVYTGAFTPPTLAPITTAGSTSAASYSSTTNVNTSFTAASTSLLTNFTNAGIYDAAVQNNVITVGDAQSSTTQFKWSPTSMKFDGTGDWLTAIDGPQLQLGTGDFTLDGWVYLSAIGVAYGIISKGTATTGWSVNVTALNKLQFSYTASNLTGTTSLATGTWYYFAVVRSGSATGNLKIYLNGTADATSGGAVTDNFNQTSILYVGADRIGTSALNGYLQDVRITKYARTITTPTAAFPTR
jgi:hypothetical protein